MRERTVARNTQECSKRPSSKAAASEGARRTLRYVERLSEARTPLEDFFSILLEQCLEFVNGQAGIANDSTHGDGIDGIMTIRWPLFITRCLLWRTTR